MFALSNKRVNKFPLLLLSNNNRGKMLWLEESLVLQSKSGNRDKQEYLSEQLLPLSAHCLPLTAAVPLSAVEPSCRSCRFPPPAAASSAEICLSSALLHWEKRQCLLGSLPRFQHFKRKGERKMSVVSQRAYRNLGKGTVNVEIRIM